MKYLLVVVILLQLQRDLHVQALGPIFISQTEQTWSNAVQNCSLATPTLVYGDDIRIENLEYNFTKDVWIGYFRKKTGFQYIGCNNKADLFSPRNLTQNSPGNCTSACGGNSSLHIGLSQHECYCIDSQRTLTPRTACTKECSGQKWAACGDLGTVSLYKIVDEQSLRQVNGNSETGNCVQAQRDSKLSWHYCSTSLLSICSTANQTIFVDSQNHGSWNKALNRCFELKLFPANLHDSKNYSGVAEAWTGILRSEVIYNYRVEGHLRETNVEYMFINSNKEIQFASDGVKQFLCYNDTENRTFTEATKTTDVIKTTGSTTKTDTSKTTERTVTTETTKTTWITKATNTTKTTRSTMVTNVSKATDSTKETESGASVGVPVGVSVTLVLVIGIVIVVVVIRRRRAASQQTKESEDKVNNLEHNKLNDYKEIPGVKLTNEGLRYSEILENDHVYHEVKKTNEGETGKALKCNAQLESVYNHADMPTDVSTDVNRVSYSHTYFVLEQHNKHRVVDADDGTYNVAGAYKPNEVKQSDNVYNKLNATYDQLHKNETTSMTRCLEQDDTYNTRETILNTRKTAVDTDHVYNKVSAFDENDTYNHTSGITCKVTNND